MGLRGDLSGGVASNYQWLFGFKFKQPGLTGKLFLALEAGES